MRQSYLNVITIQFHWIKSDGWRKNNFQTCNNNWWKFIRPLMYYFLHLFFLKYNIAVDTFYFFRSVGNVFRFCCKSYALCLLHLKFNNMFRNEKKITGTMLKIATLKNENFQIRQSIGLSIKFPLWHTHTHMNPSAISSKWTTFACLRMRNQLQGPNIDICIYEITK